MIFEQPLMEQAVVLLQYMFNLLHQYLQLRVWQGILFIV